MKYMANAKYALIFDKHYIRLMHQVIPNSPVFNLVDYETRRFIQQQDHHQSPVYDTEAALAASLAWHGVIINICSTSLQETFHILSVRIRFFRCVICNKFRLNC